MSRASIAVGVRLRARRHALAAHRRLPAVYGTREYVDAGGLTFHGIGPALPAAFTARVDQFIE